MKSIYRIVMHKEKYAEHIRGIFDKEVNLRKGMAYLSQANRPSNSKGLSRYGQKLSRRV